MNSNKNIMYISNTSPLYYTVDLVSVVSVLVLTLDHNVGHQPAGLLEPGHVPAPVHQDSAAHPSVVCPESEATICWSLEPILTHRYIYLSFLEAVVIATTSGSHLEKEITILKL